MLGSQAPALHAFLFIKPFLTKWETNRLFFLHPEEGRDLDKMPRQRSSCQMKEQNQVIARDLSEREREREREREATCLMKHLKQQS